MSAVSRIASLLLVQKGRVDRALGLVHERNRVLGERELERDSARQRWADAATAYRVQQEYLVESIMSASGSGTPAVGLSSASGRCDEHRKQMTAAAEQLATAEDRVTAAASDAMEARTTYRRTLARQEALMNLHESWREAREQRLIRLEEQEA